MNSYALAAMAAIQDYHDRHGSYPSRVEATPEYMEKIECTHLECMELPGPMDFTALDSTGLRTPIVTSIPVVPIGTGDIIFRGLLVKNTDINQKKAEYATAEQFQRIGAKLARAGCLIVEPKESGGCVTYNPHLFFSQIEAWAFGEQAAFDEVLADRLHEE